jgi:aquaporin TIP
LFDTGKLYGSTSNTGGLLIVSLAHAFAYCAALAVSAPLSSGYANPAITFGTLLGGRISLIRALFYWSAQLLGSIAASLVLRVTTGGMVNYSLQIINF